MRDSGVELFETCSAFLGSCSNSWKTSWCLWEDLDSLTPWQNWCEPCNVMHHCILTLVIMLRIWTYFMYLPAFNLYLYHILSYFLSGHPFSLTQSCEDRWPSWTVSPSVPWWPWMSMPEMRCGPCPCENHVVLEVPGICRCMFIFYLYMFV